MRKSLASIILVGASLIPSLAESRIYNIPLRENTNLQYYFNVARDGDTLTFYPDGENRLYSGGTTNKSLTIDGAGYTFLNTITLTGNADTSFKNILWSGYTDKGLNVTENASAKVTNTTFTNLRNSIYFNSTGNLDVNNSNLEADEHFLDNAIYVGNVTGRVSITENIISWGRNGVTINPSPNPTAINPTLNILNNDFFGYSESALRFQNQLNAEGLIANNSFTNSNKAIENANLSGNVRVGNNNFYNNLVNKITPDNGLQSVLTSSEMQDYFYDPLYLSAPSNFGLNPNSPLIGKGLYLEGITTWFPNQQSTYLGSQGAVPEVSSIALLGLGASLIVSRKVRKGKER